MNARTPFASVYAWFERQAEMHDGKNRKPEARKPADLPAADCVKNLNCAFGATQDKPHDQPSGIAASYSRLSV
jgi:hypothetical protein